MSTHTPGPWAYDGPPDNIHVVQADHPHMRVCFLTSNGPTEANARLIASAPDMLAALKAALPDIELGTEAYSMVRAVIAKAEKP